MNDLIRAPLPGEIDALHRAFCSAFSDYLVKGSDQISQPVFSDLLRSRGFDSDSSRVVVDPDGSFSAFWLTAIEGRAAYDIATGVVPGRRRRGLGRELWHSVKRQLQNDGVASCSLEVIVGNDRAIALYRELGFEIRRELDCYSFDNLKLVDEGRAEFRSLDEPDWELFESWWSWRPSWQHSIASVIRAGSAAKVIGAEREGDLIGYGVVMPDLGYLAQIAVSPTCRRSGIATDLVARLANELSEGVALRAVNVASDDEASRLFFESIGGHCSIKQLEMEVVLE